MRPVQFLQSLPLRHERAIPVGRPFHVAGGKKNRLCSSGFACKIIRLYPHSCLSQAISLGSFNRLAFFELNRGAL